MGSDDPVVMPIGNWIRPDRWLMVPQTVFVRTNKNYVYRSGDEGKNWEKQNWKMDGSQSEEDGKSGVLSFHVSPVDTSKVR